MDELIWPENYLDEDLGGGGSRDGELEFLDDLRGSSRLREPDGGHLGGEGHF